VRSKWDFHTVKVYLRTAKKPSQGRSKALEFLIKDYVIRLHPEKADEIRKINLGRCISDYVKSERSIEWQCVPCG